MNCCTRERMRRSTERYYREVLGLPDWSTRTQQRLARGFEQTMFQRLQAATGSLAGKTVLDLGCGWGGIVPHAAGVADVVFGIEPDVDRLSIAADMLARAGQARATVIRGVGEALPFAAERFDVVASYQVLEHVRDPAAVVSEVHRVLKPGGVFHFNTPNYMGFREPHYKVVWLPMLPKWLARIYLRLRGRNAEFIGHIRYVNPLSVRAMLRRTGFVVRDVHELRAREKLDMRLRRLLPDVAGAASLRRALNALGALPIFLIYILFLNPEQEYLAVKKGGGA